MIDELIGLAEPKELGLASYIHLIRSPTQETLELPTQPPVADFDTGFKDKSVEELAEYYEMRWDIEFLGGR